MLGTVRHYFAKGNTARGAYYLYDSAFQGLSKIFLLKGTAGTGKSTTIKRISDEMIKQGRIMELFHSPLNPESLDAVIITDLKIGIVDESSCEGLDSMENTDIVSFDFGLAVDEGKLSDRIREEIESLKQKLIQAYTNAYSSFAEALRIHDSWEQVYISHMDFQKANQIAQELLKSLFGKQKLNKLPRVRHLFFGASTSKGTIDHIQNLTLDLETRIFIKGRPGSGKSTLLKQLAKSAEQKGFDVEAFHCGFDPNSLDMLIFPELSLAIFDSTAPHLYFPNRIGDEVLDMYARTIQPGTDERHAIELTPTKIRYTHYMKEATGYLKEALELESGISAYFTAATDFTYINHLYGQLLSEIESKAVHS